MLPATDSPSVETPSLMSSLTTPPLSNPPPETSIQEVMSSPQHPWKLPHEGEGYEGYAGLKQKRNRLDLMPSDDSFPRSHHPSKKVKIHLTSVSAKRKPEVVDTHSHRMLQLARASRTAFEAQAKYHLSRIRKLDVMRTIAHEEYREAQSFVREANHQISIVRHTLTTLGVSLVDNSPSCKVPMYKLSPVSSCSDLLVDTDVADTDHDMDQDDYQS